MAYEESLRSITLVADASIGVYTGPPGVVGSASPNSGKHFRFVKVVGANTAGLCTAATDVHAGILQNKPQGAGHAATVGFSGVSAVVAGAAVAAGDLVASDAQGRAVTDAVNGRWQALEAASAAGQLIPVFRVL